MTSTKLVQAEINRFLRSETPEVLCITGKWGVGKTYAWKHFVSLAQAHAQPGDNRSPALRWQGAPEGTKSFVLVVEDHDAPVGTVTHWVTYDMGHTGYDGPKPPKGHGPHRYHFRLAALDTDSLGLSGTPDSNAVKKAARSHVLSEPELVGTFETV